MIFCDFHLSSADASKIASFNIAFAGENLKYTCG